MTQLMPPSSVRVGDVIDGGGGYWLAVRQIPPAVPTVQGTGVHVSLPFAGVWLAPTSAAGTPGFRYVDSDCSMTVRRQN